MAESVNPFSPHRYSLDEWSGGEGVVPVEGLEERLEPAGPTAQEAAVDLILVALPHGF